MAHTHALHSTAALCHLGQSPNDARRPRSVQQSCPPRARLSIASSLLSNTTAIPLNTTVQRISFVLIYDCREAPPLALRASLPTVGSPSLHVGAPRSGRFGRLRVGLRPTRGRSPSPLTPWLAASCGPAAAGRHFAPQPERLSMQLSDIEVPHC